VGVRVPPSAPRNSRGYRGNAITLFSSISVVVPTEVPVENIPPRVSMVSRGDTS
jgi:hypothetical protein